MSIRLVVMMSLALVFFSGCGKKKEEPQPYRGTFLRNLKIKTELQNKWISDKKFDPAKNCVQMITRDKTIDGVRKIEKLVLFSPEACPEGQEVAAREAFVVPFTEALNTTATLAYYLVSDGTVVGNVDRLDADDYELADVCTLTPRFRQNCDIQIDPNSGTFALLSTTRSAVGRMEREIERMRVLMNRMATLESRLHDHLNSTQREIINYVKGRVAEMERNILIGQKTTAMQVSQDITRGMERVAAGMNQANRAAFEEMSRSFTEQLEENRRQIFSQLASEFRTHRIRMYTALTLSTVTLSVQIQQAKASLLQRLNQMETFLAANDWVATTVQYYLIRNDLNTMQTALEGHVTNEVCAAFEETRQFVESQIEQLTLAIKTELNTMLGRISLKFVMMEAQLGNLADQIRFTRNDISNLQTAMETNQTNITELLRSLKEEQLPRLLNDVGTRIDASRRLEITQLTFLIGRMLLVQTWAHRQMLRSQLGPVNNSLDEIKRLLNASNAQQRQILDNIRAVQTNINVTRFAIIANDWATAATQYVAISNRMSLLRTQLALDRSLTIAGAHITLYTFLTTYIKKNVSNAIVAMNGRITTLGEQVGNINGMAQNIQTTLERAETALGRHRVDSIGTVSSLLRIQLLGALASMGNRLTDDQKEKVSKLESLLRARQQLVKMRLESLLDETSFNILTGHRHDNLNAIHQLIRQHRGNKFADNRARTQIQTEITRLLRLAPNAYPSAVRPQLSIFRLALNHVDSLHDPKIAYFNELANLRKVLATYNFQMEASVDRVTDAVRLIGEIAAAELANNAETFRTKVNALKTLMEGRQANGFHRNVTMLDVSISLPVRSVIQLSPTVTRE